MTLELNQAKLRRQEIMEELERIKLARADIDRRIAEFRAANFVVFGNTLGWRANAIDARQQLEIDWRTLQIESEMLHKTFTTALQSYAAL